MSTTTELENNKAYRGFTEDGEYYYKDLKFKIKDVPFEKINEWETIIAEIQKIGKITEEGLNRENLTSEDILHYSLDGWNQKISNSIHPRVRIGIASDLYIFLLTRPPKEELDLLQNRLKRIEQFEKSTNQ